MRNSCFDILLAALLLVTGCRVSNGDTGPGTNLALGRPYRVTPAPAYHLTRSPDDNVKLTDGRYASGHFWSDRRATVGWQNSGPVRIEIDLEKDALVDTITLSTARGQRADVSFPDRADLFVGDAYGYLYLGDLMAGQEKEDGSYRKKVFRTKGLRARGKKALIVLKPKGNFLFVDEIEVSGLTAPPTGAPDARPRVTPASLDAFLDERVSLAVERRALAVLAREARAREPRRGKEVPELEKILEELERGVQEIAPKRLSELRDALFVASRPQLAEYGTHLIVWKPDPWAEFSPLTLPPRGDAGPAGVAADLPEGGTFSASLALANPTASPLPVSVSVSLPGPAGAAPRVALREVIPVVRSDFRTVGDPLERFPGKLVLLPGESRQVFLTIESGEAAPGLYRGEVRVGATGLLRAIPLEVRVWPVRLERPARGAVNAWSYLTWRPVRDYPEAAASDLEHHRVNVIVVHPDQIPWPGREYRELDRVVRLHPFAKQFLLYLGFNDPGRRTLGIGEPFLSPRWKEQFLRWVREVGSHLRQTGVAPESFAFYPVDEPGDESEAEVLVQVARLIKEADPSLRVYTTLGDFGRFGDLSLERIVASVDRFQVGVDALGDARVGRLLRAGKDVWSYGGGGKLSHPFADYRLQAWQAARHGAGGIGIWAYADTGATGTAWNDFDGSRPDFSLVYEAKGGFLASKRWEAWREGAEDFELIALARERAVDPFEQMEVDRIVAEVARDAGGYRLFLQARRRLLEIAAGGAP